MKGKRLSIMLLCALLLLPGPSARAGSQRLQEAWREAVRHVPASALPVRAEEREGVFWFLFEDKQRSIVYEVEVLSEFLSLRTVRMAASGLKGAPGVAILPDEIKAAVSAGYPGAQIQALQAAEQSGLWHYEGYFVQPELGRFYHMQFDAQTGELMSYVMKQAAPESQGNRFFDAKQARAVASARAGEGSLMDMDFSLQEERYVYRMLLGQGEEQTALIIDAVSGAILQEESGPAAISPGNSGSRSADAASRSPQAASKPAVSQQAAAAADRPPARDNGNSRRPDNNGKKVRDKGDDDLPDEDADESADEDDDDETGNDD